MEIKIAAVVLNYNGFEDTKACIDSLLAANFVPHQIYLVDNCSPDNSGERLRQHFLAVQYFSLPQNSGYAAGNNFGLKQAIVDGCTHLLIVNNDVVVTPGFLDPLLKESQSTEVGAVTGKVLYKDFPAIINAAGGTFKRLLCSGVNLQIGKPDRREVQTYSIDFMPGMLILVKKDVIDKVGYMDEKYFLYFEDLDFSRRIRSLYSMVYTSESVVYHKSGGGMRGRTYSAVYLYYHTRNRLWFFRRDPLLYRGYVLLFSLVNVAAKSAIILLLTSETIANRITKLKSLWKGFQDGILAPDGV